METGPATQRPAFNAMTALALAGAALCGASMAHAAAAQQDWAAVDAQTQNIAQALGRSAAPIDRRIKLAKCPEQLAITAMDSSSLAVRCASLGWRLRVAMISNASQNNAGQDNIGGFFAPAETTPRRTAAAAPIIRRGDVVRISIDTPNYSVSYPATATQDGRLGEAISLRGADPKNPIMAVVTGPGRANISR